MKMFERTCAQGDVMFRRVKSLPKGCTGVAPVNDRLVVTHSESGHSHVMVLDKSSAGDNNVPAVEMFAGNNPLIAWLKVNRPTALEHLRPHDTHEPIMFAPGIYEVRRQREYTPEGWRQVQD
jgi:hypothetical protein